MKTTTVKKLNRSKIEGKAGTTEERLADLERDVLSLQTVLYDLQKDMTGLQNRVTRALDKGDTTQTG